MKARISSAALQQIVAAAAASPDAEICGLLFGSADAIEHAEPCANVAADPAYGKARQELADRLLKVLKDTGDPRVVEADCRFERAPFTDPEPKKK